MEDQLSNYEKQRKAKQDLLLESAWHAFDADSADWGWFDPREWFEFAAEVEAWNGRMS